MADCLFCKIAAKELDSDVVHESDSVLAFEDINPAAPTHVLVDPERAHRLGCRPGPEATATFSARCSSVDRQDAPSKARPRRADRIVTNVGPDAGQSVHHLHFHLLGGRSMAWPPG